MRIQILTSKNSWAFKKRKNFILSNLKKFSNKINLLNNHHKLKKNFDVTIIINYYQIIPEKYLLHSKHNLVVHESNLPRGRGWSPLYRQIIDGKSKIITTLFECSKKMDEGSYYYKKSFLFKKNLVYSELKDLQLLNALSLIKKFLTFYMKNKISPKKNVQKGKPSYFKKLNKLDSKININQSLKSQIDRLRTVDHEIFPAFFYYKKRKFFIKIEPSQ